MIITRDKIIVYKIPNDDPDDARPWYRIRIMLPQLMLETPNLYTHEYANDLLDMMMAESYCPFCGANQNDWHGLNWYNRLRFHWSVFKHRIKQTKYRKFKQV